DHKGRYAHRQDDIPIYSKEPGPVHRARFDQLIRHAYVVVAKYERGDRYAVNYVDEDQARYVGFQWRNARYELEQRQQHRLVRDEHAEKHERKDEIGI